MSSTLEASVFMGKNYSDNFAVPQKYTENFHKKKKQMFEISEKLILNNQMRFLECLKSVGPWKQLSLVNDEEVISLSHAKVYVFSDSVLFLGKMNQNLTSNYAWEEKLT